MVCCSYPFSRDLNWSGNVFSKILVWPEQGDLTCGRAGPALTPFWRKAWFTPVPSSAYFMTRRCSMCQSRFSMACSRETSGKKEAQKERIAATFTLQHAGVWSGYGWRPFTELLSSMRRFNFLNVARAEFSTRIFPAFMSFHPRTVMVTGMWTMPSNE